jgi:hypothetical protein
MSEFDKAYRELSDFLIEKIEVQQQKGHVDFALSKDDTLHMLRLLFVADREAGLLFVVADREAGVFFGEEDK